MVFMKSWDALDKIKTTETLALKLEHIAMEVGVDNLVQIIADNAVAYVATGRILQDKYSTLFWFPYAVHVFDLLLDYKKFDLVRSIVEDA